VFAGEITQRLLARYEAGELIALCGWCLKVELDGEWHLAPRVAFAAMDTRYTISHSICPACDVAQGRPAAPVLL
jgi:hypothetical protein